MPPKVKTESTELQVFNLENLNPALLPELATFKEIQLKVVAENPFIAITPAKTESFVERMIPLVEAYNIAELKQMQSTTTWDDIEKDFKLSGEKSYSKWLKSNYNVPTKL